MTYNDLSVERDNEGIYDLVIEGGDLKKTGGMHSAIFTSLFTDRRANPDEVANPMKRRGWCGTQNTPGRQGNKGSGLWFYMQSRLTELEETGVKRECRQALAWLITDGLAKSVTVQTKKNPANRSLDLTIKIVAVDGGEVTASYNLWSETERRTFEV